LVFSVFLKSTEVPLKYKNTTVAVGAGATYAIFKVIKHILNGSFSTLKLVRGCWWRVLILSSWLVTLTSCLVTITVSP